MSVPPPATPQRSENRECAPRELARTPFLPPPQRDQDHQRAEAPSDGHSDRRERAERVFLRDDRPTPHDRRGDERAKGGYIGGFIHVVYVGGAERDPGGAQRDLLD